MIYTVNSQKSLNEIDSSFREAAQRHKFGILNVLDMKQTLFTKGIEIGRECRIYDVCNPHAASQALAQNMAVSAVLPCRISVFTEGESTLLATVRPTDLMRATGLPGVEALAADIEREIITIMDESAK